MSREGEKISFSEGGGGINIVFGPKYRPLWEYEHRWRNREEREREKRTVKVEKERE